MILNDIDLIKNQLQQHQATHGKFTIEVAKQALLLTETHVQLADLLRTSRLETKQEESEYHDQQALQEVARLASLTFLETRPTFSYNLRTVQVAAHLGLGGLYRDQYLNQKAMEQLTKAYDLTQQLIITEDSPGQQERLTTHGEIRTLDATLEETHSALEKQQKAPPAGKDNQRPFTRIDTPQTNGIINLHGRYTREARTLHRIPRGNARVSRYRRKSADRKQYKPLTPASLNSCQYK